MNTINKSIPLWILLVSGFFALMELIVSGFIWFAPESVLETVDLQAKGVDYVVQLWATRQFALGFIFAFSTFRKSKPMLTISYVFLLVMFLGDLLIGFSQKESPLILSAGFMCLVASAMLFSLSKQK